MFALFFFNLSCWAIMVLHNFPSFFTSDQYFRRTIVSRPYSAIHFHKLLGYVTVSVSLSMSVQYQILQLFFMHNVSQNVQLPLSDSKCNSSLSFICFVNFPVAHMFSLWYSQHSSLEPHLCCLKYHLWRECQTVIAV